MTRLAPRSPGAVRRIARALPEGGALPDPVFWSRHRAICAVLALHGLGLALTALAQGHPASMAAAVAAAPAACALVASAVARLPGGRRGVASCTAATGLLVSSAELVALFEGLTEMHFHFFVTLAIVALYQDWAPYLLAVGFVLVEHGVVGALAPGGVFGHGAHGEAPWRWAAVHAGFVAATSIATLAGWRQQETARRLADTDPLTGLVNHRRFHELLGEALAATARGGSSVSVAMMDLDHFKAVNDAWGHVVGDQILRETADRLRRSARSDDVLARVGGEEFAWLLRGADRAGAARAVERGREAVSALPMGPVARVTLSAGVCEARPDMTPRDVVGSADTALYLAKAAGRDALREVAELT